MNDMMPSIRFSISISHMAFPLCAEVYTVREEVIDEDKIIYYSYYSITLLCFNVEICAKRGEYNAPPVYNWEGE